MDEPYVCSVTYLRVRNPLVLPAFFLNTWRVTRAARRTPGYVSHRLLGMPPLPFYWTLSVWASPAAMRAFVATPEHRRAMEGMAVWGRLGKFARFTSAKRRVAWRRALPHLRHADGVWTPASIYSPS
jgi:heme-degrading monooxygenase HmoA